MSGKGSILIPEYMETFTCIGGDCEDTCCVGFRVELDRKTYEHYKTLEDDDLQADIEAFVRPLDEQQTEKRFGYIEKQEDGRCSFMNETNLCKLHLRHGSDALGIICHTYPRIVNIVDDTPEQSASISCPEIARLALLNKDGIRFVETDMDANERHNIGFNIDSSKKSSSFWEIRLFSLNTLQDRQYTVVERLLILAMYFQKVDETLPSGQNESIPSITEKYDNLCQTGAFKQVVDKLPINLQWKYALIGKLLIGREQFPISNRRFHERFYKAIDQLGLKSESLKVDPYIAKMMHWETTFTEKYDYIFENFIVNQAFRTLFPFRGYSNFSEEFMMLAIHYACIRMMAIGVACAAPDTFDEHELISCIQSYSKEVDHHAVYVKFIYDTLKLNDCTTTAKLSAILKGI